MKTFEFDLNTGVATMTLQAGTSIHLTTLDTVVNKAGFTVKRMELAVVGTLVESSGPDGQESLALRIASTGQDIFLGPGATESLRNTYVAVREWADSRDQKISVVGQAHEHADDSIGLVIQAFEIIN